MYKILWFFVVSISAFSQANGVVRGPLSGYVGDAPTQSIRPIVGVLGGAYLGNAVLEGVTKAWVAPEGGRAVILRQDQYFLISGLDTGVLRTDETPMEVAGPDAIVAWATDGTLVAVAGNGSLQIAGWRGTDKVWAVDSVRVIPIGIVKALAVNSKIKSLAVAISQDDGVGVHVGPAWGGELKTIYVGRAVSALAYSHTRETLYVSDRGEGQILSFTGSGARAEGVGSSNPDEYRDVIALAVASDDGAVYSVHADRRVVVKHSLADRSIHAVEVDGTPNGITSIPATGLYIVALREKASDSVLAFDSLSDVLYFIPGGGVQ